jgi:hypothetical protein
MDYTFSSRISHFLLISFPLFTISYKIGIANQRDGPVPRTEPIQVELGQHEPGQLGPQA